MHLPILSPGALLYPSRKILQIMSNAFLVVIHSITLPLLSSFPVLGPLSAKKKKKGWLPCRLERLASPMRLAAAERDQPEYRKMLGKGCAGTVLDNNLRDSLQVERIHRAGTVVYAR